jgi:hypothetical protein
MFVAIAEADFVAPDVETAKTTVAALGEWPSIIEVSECECERLHLNAWRAVDDLFTMEEVLAVHKARTLLYGEVLARLPEGVTALGLTLRVVVEGADSVDIFEEDTEEAPAWLEVTPDTADDIEAWLLDDCSVEGATVDFAEKVVKAAKAHGWSRGKAEGIFDAVVESALAEGRCPFDALDPEAEVTPEV